MDYKKLIERLRDLAVYTRKEYSETAVEDAMFKAATAIETLLAEREAAVKHGEWIDKGWDGDWAWHTDGRGRCWKVIECSVCGKPACDVPKTPFCPNCGAKMKSQSYSTPPDRQQAES